MNQPKIIYVHGGEGFDTPWEGLKALGAVLLWKSLGVFKPQKDKWPDTLCPRLGADRVIKLKMPRKYNAKYEAWKAHFESQIDTFGSEVVLVGWSLGANFLAKYLSENSVPFSVKHVHLIAGCYGLGGGFYLAENFPGPLRDYDITLYHSKDDFVVPFSDFEAYRSALPAAETMVFLDRNHFLQPEFEELLSRLGRDVYNNG